MSASKPGDGVSPDQRRYLEGRIAARAARGGGRGSPRRRRGHRPARRLRLAPLPPSTNGHARPPPPAPHVPSLCACATPGNQPRPLHHPARRSALTSLPAHWPLPRWLRAVGGSGAAASSSGTAAGRGPRGVSVEPGRRFAGLKSAPRLVCLPLATVPASFARYHRARCGWSGGLCHRNGHNSPHLSPAATAQLE